MPTEAIGATVPEATEATIVMDVDPRPDKTESSKPDGLHSPPDSNNATNFDGSDSELSDIEDRVADQLRDEAPPAPSPAAEPVVEDIGEIVPDHYSGTVPVFKPSMKQFKDFKLFMEKIDSYGMQSGIVKIIPPQEWKDSLPPLDNLIKQVRVREPIKQDIMGSNGTYRQVNILHQRSYNVPQWRQLCDQSEHQPPARRGERRANVEKPKPKPATRPRPAPAATGTRKSAGKGRRGRGGRGGRKSAASAKETAAEPEERPMTPVSPVLEGKPLDSVEEDDPVIKGEDTDDDAPPAVGRMGVRRPASSKTQSVSARRKFSKREGSAKIDEAAFKDFDYQMDVSDYTPERCEELERIYWKTLTYAPPLYGADLMGTLFDESTEQWNLNKLPNLLDVLGTKVPGVNTAYLYLGMWKATFAWHLEDVDLYSINYLHFGAPKQWYSISQKDARRFEAAMKNVWSADARACDQFLRHKGYLISPSHLKQHYNITVNKCVSYPGEFVVTYPYGYHSGYNLGYNCAEAVNFALDSWLPIGKVAKKCDCAQAQDSVWVDVYEVERKLRGESTEYEETEDEEDEEDEEDDNSGLPSPPSSHTVKVKGAAGRKRKRAAGDKGGKVKVKKIRLRPKSAAEPVCCLCPNDIPGAEILPTSDGRKAHRMCALYVPETYIEIVDGKDVIANAANIDKARLDLKCLYCRSKKGACFQCSQKKCARSYHATCAAAAGVFVEEAEVPVFGEDGTEYKEQAFEFSCRFHRTKRDRKWDGADLEGDLRVRAAAAALKKDQICQLQYHRGDIFAGVVVENRHDEQTLLVDVIPAGDRVEVEWKWLLIPDQADFRLPRASAKAVPMPTSKKAKEEINATKRVTEELPRKDDTFAEGYTWAEFHTRDDARNPAQKKVDMSKESQVWHYLGKTSTESKAQYTGNPANRVHDPKSNFLDSIPKPKPVYVPRPQVAQPKRASYPAAYPAQSMPPPPTTMAAAGSRPEKPYVYKPRKSIDSMGPTYGGAQLTAQRFAPKAPVPMPGGPQSAAPGRQLAFGTDPQFKGPKTTTAATATTTAPTPQSSNRFAPVGGSNGFPKLPGLTWPPAHMSSGQYSQPQSRAWSPAQPGAAGSRPYQPVPMTSSLLGKAPRYSQSGGGGGATQRSMSTYQKYSFFQVHHNRDSSRYRTPYATWGGFTNGYEGNLRAFLIKAQHSLSGKKGPIQGIPPSLLKPIQSGAQSSAPANSAPPAPAAPPRYGSPYSQNPPQPAAPSAALSTPGPGPGFSHQHPQVPTPANPPVRQSSSPAPLHPAIRPRYEAAWSQSYGPAAPGQAAGPMSQPIRQGSPSTPARPKSPTSAKQSYSPIPLPPYVSAASQGATPASTSSQMPPTGQQLQRGSPSPHAAQQPHPPAVGRAAAPPVYAPQSQQPSHPHQFTQASCTPAQPFAGADANPFSKGRPEALPGARPDPVMQPTQPSAILDSAAPHVHGKMQEPQGAARDSQIPPIVDSFPEVPADSAALIEKMMRNIRRASGASETPP